MNKTRSQIYFSLSRSITLSDETMALSREIARQFFFPLRKNISITTKAVTANGAIDVLFCFVQWLAESNNGFIDEKFDFSHLPVKSVQLNQSGSKRLFMDKLSHYALGKIIRYIQSNLNMRDKSINEICNLLILNAVELIKNGSISTDFIVRFLTRKANFYVVPIDANTINNSTDFTLNNYVGGLSNITLDNV